MTSPEALCIRCRALLGAAQACSCVVPELITLDEQAPALIAEKMLVTPKVGNEGLILRIAAGVLPLCGLFVVAFVLLSGLWPVMARAWPIIFGGPFGPVRVWWTPEMRRRTRSPRW